MNAFNANRCILFIVVPRDITLTALSLTYVEQLFYGIYSSCCNVFVRVNELFIWKIFVLKVN